MQPVGQTSFGSPLYFVQQLTSDVRLMHTPGCDREWDGYYLYYFDHTVTLPDGRKAKHFEAGRKFHFDDELEQAIELITQGVPIDVINTMRL